MDRAPIVDVLLPAYNAARTIEGSLESIRAQTLRDWRVFAVDDGSTDATPDILRRVADRDPRIVVVTTKNGGVVDALNTALDRSTATFVARHDADDLSFPDRFERQLAFMTRRRDVVAVGGNAHHIDEHGVRTGVTTTFKAEVVSDAWYAPSLEPYLLHPFLFARRQAMVEAGGYRYAFHSEDTDLYWRLAERGTLANLTDVLGEYRLHAGSISSRSVLNGRIAAVSAQRAAVSARRRRAGEPDIEFTRSSLERYHAAVELAPILEIASEGLSPSERRYLSVATAAKMVELAAYRPYRLTAADRRTIRGAIRANYDVLTEFNQRQLIFRLLLAPRPLMRRPVERLSVVPWDVMPRALRNAARQRTRRLLGRTA